MVEGTRSLLKGAILSDPGWALQGPMKHPGSPKLRSGKSADSILVSLKVVRSICVAMERVSPNGAALPAGKSRTQLRRVAASCGVISAVVAVAMMTGDGTSQGQEQSMMTQSMTKDDMAQMFDGETEIKDYPRWAKTTDQINAAPTCNLFAVLITCTLRVRGKEIVPHTKLLCLQN